VEDATIKAGAEEGNENCQATRAVADANGRDGVSGMGEEKSFFGRRAAKADNYGEKAAPRAGRKEGEIIAAKHLID